MRDARVDTMVLASGVLTPANAPDLVQMKDYQEAILLFVFFTNVLV
jgi:hypothetical protein